MASGNYAEGVKNAYLGNFDYRAATAEVYKLRPLTDGYTPNFNLGGDERPSATNIAQSGAADEPDQTVTPVDIRAGVGDIIEFDVSEASVTFTAIDSGQNIAGCQFFRWVTTNGDSFLLSWNEFPSPIAGNGSDIIVTPGADGLFTVNPS